MVLYKRKHVTYVRPPPIPDDLSTEVFYIPATKEWFYTYEEYIKRLDFFQQRKFVCEITGNSCLTFFQALESEKREIKGVEKNFPEALREHILRFLQFNRITRLDHLVDKVYLSFRNDYFPGETIYIKGAIVPDHNGSSAGAPVGKQRGTIREKVQYSNPADGLTTKYLVVRLHDMQQAIVTKDKISRDRNHFTKWLIKTFIKLTMTRSPKVGAPWVVKEKYAKKYRIPQEFPEDLRHYKWSTPIADVVFEGDSALPEMPDSEQESLAIKQALEASKRNKKNAAKGRKKPALNNLLDDSTPDGGDALDIKPTDPTKPLPTHYLPDKLQRELDFDDSKLDSIQPTKKNVSEDLDLRFDLQNTKPQPTAPQLSANAWKHTQTLIARRREELDNLGEAEEEASEKVKKDPAYREFCALETSRLQRSLSFSCVQEALETWSFLNIYHRALKLDTFTFDDFVYAMGWTWEEYEHIGRCELVDEVWCAVLGAFVSNELPTSLDDDDDDDEVFGLLVNLPANEKVEPESKAPTPLKEETPEVKKEEETDQDNGDTKSPSDSLEEEEEEETSHNAYKIMNYRGTPWHDRLRKRNFKEGNWQGILLGVLSMVEYVPEYQLLITRVFKILAPPDLPANPSTALSQFYDAFDFELRLQTLCLLVTLLSNGTIVRRYIDECLEQSTVYRRSRLDNIRDYKAMMEVAVAYHEQLEQVRAELEDRLNKENNGDVGIDKEIVDTKNPSEERKRAKLNLLAFEMNDDDKRFADMSDDYRTAWESRKETLQKMEHIRKERRQIERKLVELDSQRLKLLGKDRLFNRYWWFENNGLPTLHGTSKDEDNDDEEVAERNEDDSDVDDGEVIDETYLMGTLWVQGPSKDDVRIHLELSEAEADRLSNSTEHLTKEVKFHVPPTEDNVVLNELDFTNIPASFSALAATYGVTFDKNSVFVGLKEESFLDQWGCLRRDHRLITPVQRKFLEEYPSPLFSGSNWRVYTEPEQIKELLDWLNPWGKRESQLRKELAVVGDAIKLSMEARKKAMWLADDNNGTASGTKETEKPEEQNTEAESEDDINASSGKRNRQSTGRRKRANISDSASSDEETKVPMTRELNRALEWMNSLARDELEKLLYEGGDKAKAKGRKKK